MAIVWEEIKMSPGSLLSICKERETERERGKERKVMKVREVGS